MRYTFLPPHSHWPKRQIWLSLDLLNTKLIIYGFSRVLFLKPWDISFHFKKRNHSSPGAQKNGKTWIQSTGHFIVNLPKARDFLASHLWRGQSEWYYHQTLKLLCAKFIKQTSLDTQGVNQERQTDEALASLLLNEKSRLHSELRKDSSARPPWLSAPRPPQTHCPTWPPAQSTLEPQSPQVMSQLSPLYPRGILMFLQLPTQPGVQPTPVRQTVPMSLVRFPSAVRNWPLDPLHPKAWLWHTPRA